MKNSAEEWLGRVRAFVSEVPGRPDAPLVRRVRRALPLCLPLFLLAAAAIAKAVFWEPALRARHEARFPLFELARQTTALSLAWSDQSAAEAAARAERARRSVLEGPDRLGGALETLAQTAAERGWTAKFLPIAPAEPEAGASLGMRIVEARFAPVSGKASWPALVALLESIPNGERQISLTRLAIRADEREGSNVEATLRLPFLLPHAPMAP